MHRSAVIDRLKKEAAGSDVALSYTYCEYNSSEKDQEAISILKSIARQLIENAPPNKRRILMPKVGNFLRDLVPGKRSTLEVEFLTSVTSSFRQSIVVIDALDECPAERAKGERNRSKLVDWLLEVPNLKLFITSRDMPAIRQAPSGTITLEIRPPLTAIYAYIVSLIDDRDSLSKIVNESETLKTQIIDLVASRSNEP
jgi:hypothetical protein